MNAQDAHAHARAAGSVTALDGYKAAGIEMEAMLKDAAKRKPKRGITPKMHHLAAFRAGYHAGLLVANCMHVYGEFPKQNEDAIRAILSRNEPNSPTREETP